MLPGMWLLIRGGTGVQSIQTAKNKDGLGAHFTNNISIVFQIYWKLGFSVTPL